MSDTRNVIDYYKGWEMEAIKADLNTRRNDMVVVFENVSGDFNKSTGIRNANNFSARKIVIAGRRKYDKRGTVGAHHYEHVEFADSAVEAIDSLKAEGYNVYAVDNIMPAVCTRDIVSYPAKSAFIFGEEGRGLSEEALAAAHARIYISTTGSIRSLNVGTASGIIMYDYVCKVDNNE